MRGFGITDAPCSWIVAGSIALLLAQSTGIISFFLLKVSPGEIARTHGTREEFVPHCSESCRGGNNGAVVRLMWKELQRARDVSQRN